MQSLSEITHGARKTLLAVADFLRIQQYQVQEEQIEEKSRNSLVSFVDKEAEIQLVKGLGQLISGSTFLTEEKTVEQKESDWQWIIDPLDGTTNFLHGLPLFSISVALQFKRETVMGIVHEVGQDEQFYAWKGGGAWCNDSSISVSGTPYFDKALIATGFPYYDYDRTGAYLSVLKKLMQTTRGVRRFGSAAVDLAYVAAGRFDGFFEYSLHPWDVAAGAFLVKEAGGTVTDFQGKANFLYGKEIVVGNPAIHSLLLTQIQSVF